MVGEGKMSDALGAFDKITETKGLEAFGHFHKALALASVGDFEGADEILSGRAAGPIFVMRRGVFAHAADPQPAGTQRRRRWPFWTAPSAPIPIPIVDALRVRLTGGRADPVRHRAHRARRDRRGVLFRRAPR